MPQSTTSKQDNHGLFAIFKGESGEGKSVAALSFPDPYVFDFDKKMPSVAMKHFPNKEIHWDTFATVWEVVDKINEFYNYCPYETFIIDSFTALANLIMQSIAITKGENIPDMMKKLTKSHTVETLGIDYYGGEENFSVFFLDQLKALWARPGNPRHVIVTAHVVEQTSSPDLKTKIVTKTRRIVAKGQKAAAWLPTGFDNVYLFGRQLPDMDSIDQSVKRIAKTESFGEDSAKCSFPFPETIEFTNKSFFDELCQYYDLREKKRIGEEILDVEIVQEDIK